MQAAEPVGQVLAGALKAVRASLDVHLRGRGESLPGYLVLRHIEQAPGVSQRQLAARLGIESPTLTHHLDRLAAEGLVRRERSGQDRRVWTSSLTAEGAGRLAAVREGVDAFDRQLRSLFTPSELDTLVACFHRLTDAYGRSPL